MSLLSMVTQVCRRIGITAPNAVYSSADPQIIQLLALANEEGEELSSRYPWQSMRKKRTSQRSPPRAGQHDDADGGGLPLSSTRRSITDHCGVPCSGLCRMTSGRISRPCRSMARGINTGFAGIRCFYSGSCCGGNPAISEWQSKNWCSDSTGVTTRSSWVRMTISGSSMKH